MSGRTRVWQLNKCITIIHINKEIHFGNSPLEHGRLFMALEQFYHFFALLEAALDGALVIGLLRNVQQQCGDARRPSAVRLVQQSGQIGCYLFVGQIILGLRLKCVMPRNCIVDHLYK